MQQLNKIKGYRVMAGLTQVEMAKELNMSERSYYTKETNNDKFTVDELKAIVEILSKYNLNITVNDLL